MFILRFLSLAFLFSLLKADNLGLSSVNVNSDQSSDILDVRDLLQRVVALEDYNKKQTRKIENIEREYKREITELKQQLSFQKDEIAVLRKENTQQNRFISQLLGPKNLRGKARSRRFEEQENEDHVKRTDGLKITSGTTENRIRRVANEDTVAFSAGLTKRELHLGAHQNIVFDHVETNVGNGYNPHHGVFTAPVSGLYVFYTSVLADNNREVWCELVVNGAIKASVYARGTDGRHDQGSQALVIQLKQGDDIVVQNVATDDAIYGDPTIYSTFSGFLLQQDLLDTETIVG